MSERKITEVGQLCRKCETPVIEHRADRTSAYLWWLRCPNPRCNTIYFVPEGKKLAAESTPDVSLEQIIERLAALQTPEENGVLRAEIEEKQDEIEDKAQAVEAEKEAAAQDARIAKLYKFTITHNK